MNECFFACCLNNPWMPPSELARDREIYIQIYTYKMPCIGHQIKDHPNQASASDPPLHAKCAFLSDSKLRKKKGMMGEVGRPEELMINRATRLWKDTGNIASALGYLAVFWSTVVLLGGFVGDLLLKEFWVLTALSFIMSFK